MTPRNVLFSLFTITGCKIVLDVRNAAPLSWGTNASQYDSGAQHDSLVVLIVLSIVLSMIRHDYQLQIAHQWLVWILPWHQVSRGYKLLFPCSTTLLWRSFIPALGAQDRYPLSIWYGAIECALNGSKGEEDKVKPSSNFLITPNITWQGKLYWIPACTLT